MRRVAVVLAMLGCGVAVAAETSSQFTAAESAALAALRGDAKRARSFLRVGKEESSDLAALVVLASIALDEGRITEAERLAARIRAVIPDAAEGILLQALVVERRTSPRGDWLTAAVGALQRTHPLPKSPPVLDLWAHMVSLSLDGKAPLAFSEDTVRKLDSGDAFLVRWAWPRPLRAGEDDSLLSTAMRVADSDERLPVQLAALEELASGRSGRRASEATAAWRGLVVKLNRNHPGALRLLGVEQRADTEPVTEDEVARVEALVAAEAQPWFPSEYAYLFGVFGKVDAAVASTLARNTAIRLMLGRYNPPIGVRLMRTPSLSSAQKERLGRALLRLAEFAHREGMVIADGLSMVCVGQASALLNEPGLKTRTDAIRVEMEELMAAFSCFNPLMRLPLRSFQRAWAAQVPYERGLFESMARQGVVCPEPSLRDLKGGEGGNGSGASPTQDAGRADPGKP